MITIFENFDKPDLRKMSKIVHCIKSIKYFKTGNYYKIDSMRGDPQRAIEEFGINDYLPIECISNIFIFGDDNKKYSFAINSKYDHKKDLFNKINFFDYFEIPEFAEDTDKYNL